MRASLRGWLAATAVAAAVGVLGIAGWITPPHEATPLRGYFQPSNPAWHGAQLAGGVVCWTLLDPARDARWSADYCSR